ncbi:MAG: CHAT domain-containing protein [Candidatus Eremiobacteraeota bacterium]|nr:CHAT domain-containing protein [Candidatus Eremiobacteraeota bacterium]
MSKKKSGLHLAACLVKINIIPHSPVQADEEERINILKKIVNGVMGRDWISSDPDNRIIKDTVDGMIIAYCNNREFEDSLNHAVEIRKRIEASNGEKTDADKKVNIRIGLYHGPVHLRVEADKHYYLAGNSENNVVRVADCGEAGHILSSSSYRKLFPHRKIFHYCGKYKDQSGDILEIYNIYKKDQFGNRKTPMKNRIPDIPNTQKLTIQRVKGKPDHLEFQSGGEYAAIQKIQYQVDEATMNIINSRLDDIACNLSNMEVVYSKFETLGGLMFRILLPGNIQNFITGLNSPITILTDDPKNPWELLHDGNGFLCMRVPIGRKLISQFARTQVISTPREKPSVLIIASEIRGLKNVTQEAEEIRKLLVDQDTCDVRMMVGDNLKWDDVLGTLMQNKFDIIHYAGHATLDKESQEGKLLLSDNPLTANQLMRCINGSPLFFLNACLTSRDDNNNLNADAEEIFVNSPRINLNFGTALLIGNTGGVAKAFIGSQWKIDDESARDFALSFYRYLRAGNEIGEALRLARGDSMKDYRNMPTWAAYVLYGNPRYRVFEVEEMEEEEENGNVIDIQEPRGEETGQPVTEPVQEETGLVIDKLDDSANTVLFQGIQEMQKARSASLTTPFLMTGLLKIEDGYARKFIKSNNLEPDDMIKILSELMAGDDDVKTEEIGISERVMKIFELAGEYSNLDSGENFVREKHILQGFFENGGGFTGGILREYEIDFPETREEIFLMPLFAPSRGAIRQNRERESPIFRGGEPTGEEEIGDDRQPRVESIGESFDNLRFSSFYPKEIKHDEFGKIIAYAHIESLAAVVAREAKTLLNLPQNAQIQANIKKPSRQIPKFSKVMVTADIPGLLFDSTEAIMPIWEDKQSVTFRFRIDPSFKGNVCRGWLHFWLEGMILADLRINIFITREDIPEIFKEELSQINTSPYPSVFPSYSHRDAAVVKNFKICVEALGGEYLQDISTLRTGQDWNKELMNLIKKADVFQLFWSENSASSCFVEQEWRFALEERKRRPDPLFIRPVYWSPEPVTFPKELDPIHFAPFPASQFADPSGMMDSLLLRKLREMKLDPNQVSQHVRNDLINSMEIVKMRGNSILTTSDLFMRFADNKSGETWRLLRFFEEAILHMNDIHQDVKTAVNEIKIPWSADIVISSRLKTVFKNALKIADSSADSPGIIRERHVLHSMIQDAIVSGGRSLLFLILKKYGFDLEMAARQLNIDTGSISIESPIMDPNIIGLMSEDARKAVKFARESALSRPNRYLTTSDLLIGLMELRGLTQRVFRRFEIDLEKMKKVLLPSLLTIAPPPGKGLKLSRRLMANVLNPALQVAKESQKPVDEKALLKTVINEMIRDRNCLTSKMLSILEFDPIKALQYVDE